MRESGKAVTPVTRLLDSIYIMGMVEELGRETTISTPTATVTTIQRMNLSMQATQHRHLCMLLPTPLPPAIPTPGPKIGG